MRIDTAPSTAVDGPLAGVAAPPVGGFGALLAALLPLAGDQAGRAAPPADTPADRTTDADTEPAPPGTPASGSVSMSGAEDPVLETTDGGPSEPEGDSTQGHLTVPDWLVPVEIGPVLDRPTPSPDPAPAHSAASATVTDVPSVGAPSSGTPAPGSAAGAVVAPVIERDMPAPPVQGGAADPADQHGTGMASETPPPGTPPAAQPGTQVPAAAASATAPSTEPATAPATEPGHATAPAQAPTPAQSPAPDAVAAAGTLAEVSGPTSSSAPSSSSTPASVARQVFDQIDRLSTARDGTHRLTVRLDPGTLGEVRILFTAYAGRVSVRLAAGDEARLALTSGAPDLQRLLAAHGMGEVRVDVRTLTTTMPPPDQQPGTQPGLSHDLPGSHAGPEDPGSRTGHHGAAARTRDATTATDGDPGRGDSPGSQPPRSAPPGGVDLRM